MSNLSKDFKDTIERLKRATNKIRLLIEKPKQQEGYALKRNPKG